MVDLDKAGFFLEVSTLCLRLNLIVFITAKRRFLIFVINVVHVETVSDFYSLLHM